MKDRIIANILEKLTEHDYSKGMKELMNGLSKTQNITIKRLGGMLWNSFNEERFLIYSSYVLENEELIREYYNIKDDDIFSELTLTDLYEAVDGLDSISNEIIDGFIKENFKIIQSIVLDPESIDISRDKEVNCYYN